MVKMEIFKSLKSWFSFKKDSTRDSIANQRNEERNGKLRRSGKRNAKPIPDEDSVQRKCYKKEISDIPDKTHPELKEQNVGNSCNAEENVTIAAVEEKPPLNGYELKTIKNVHEIREKCEEYCDKIDTFSDISGSRQFLYVDENLQKCIDRLDQIDAKESKIIRQERKSAIKYINSLIDKLEAIAKKNEEGVNPRPEQLPPLSREQFLAGKKEE